MGGIFLNYRREDCGGYAGRLADDITERLPGVRVFRDVDSIEVGSDFARAIQGALASSSVCLVLIGQRWFVRNAHGQPRLYEQSDLVRMEIRTALVSALVVIPVLIDAGMPPLEYLPDDLKPLASRQALDLSDKRWDYDVERLLQVVSRILGVRRPPTAPPVLVSPTSSYVKGRGIVFWTAIGGVLVASGLVASKVLTQGVPLTRSDGAALEPPARVPLTREGPAPPNRTVLSRAVIASCTAECARLAEECERPCLGGNACWFCEQERQKCQHLCTYGSCNPACFYNGRCQGLTANDDPRDCCPPSLLNDQNDCAKLLKKR